MNREWAIRSEALRKVYRLYRKPTYKLMDLFGLCPSGDQYYTEHAALDGVDLTIGKGEKVAIIGRNGAGKSTLLKLISGVLRPTSGTVATQGRIKALLDIGTGFHPDFTGRDNVVSALAYQSIVGQEARAKLDEIIDFAELDDYIDQPMKTYSTGMKMRLMFAAATCVEPAILIVDEVLSVGDAYFTHKSLERTRRLVENHGTTLLLVTHAPGLALSVCDRFIWIDHGRIMLDGPPAAAMAAYDHSIKQQEERRQLQRKIRAGEAGHAPQQFDGITLRLRPDGERLDAPLHIKSLVAAWSDGRRMECAWGEVRVDAPFRVLPSPSQVIDSYGGGGCLTVREYGDIFHQIDSWCDLRPSGDLPVRLDLTYATEGSVRLMLEMSRDGRAFGRVGMLGPTGGAWVEASLDLPHDLVATPPASPEGRAGVRYGSAEVTIEQVRMLDEMGETARSFLHGGTMRIEIDYVIRRSANIKTAVVGAGIHREGYLPVTAFVSPPSALVGSHGTITLLIENLRLTRGAYMLSVGLFRPEIQERGVFYTMSPDVFDHLPCAAMFEITTEKEPPVAWMYVQEAKWMFPVGR